MHATGSFQQRQSDCRPDAAPDSGRRHRSGQNPLLAYQRRDRTGDFAAVYGRHGRGDRCRAGQRHHEPRPGLSRQGDPQPSLGGGSGHGHCRERDPAAGEGHHAGDGSGVGPGRLHRVAEPGREGVRPNRSGHDSRLRRRARPLPGRFAASHGSRGGLSRRGKSQRPGRERFILDRVAERGQVRLARHGPALGRPA